MSLTKGQITSGILISDHLSLRLRHLQYSPDRELLLPWQQVPEPEVDLTICIAVHHNFVRYTCKCSQHNSNY